MLAAETVENLARRFRASSLHVSEASLNALDGLHALERLLVGFSVLDDNFGLTVDRQTKGLPVFLRRSTSSEVLRLKSLRDRMSLAMFQHGVSPNLR